MTSEVADGAAVWQRPAWSWSSRGIRRVRGQVDPSHRYRHTVRLLIVATRAVVARNSRLVAAGVATALIVKFETGCDCASPPSRRSGNRPVGRGKGSRRGQAHSHTSKAILSFRGASPTRGVVQASISDHRVSSGGGLGHEGSLWIEFFTP